MLCVSCLECCVRVGPGGCCTCANACASLGLGASGACFVSPRMHPQFPTGAVEKQKKMECRLMHRELRTSVPGVWAAGDCCTVRAEAQEPQWFQMRLWTQVPPMQGRRQGSTCIHPMTKHQSFMGHGCC